MGKCFVIEGSQREPTPTAKALLYTTSNRRIASPLTQTMYQYPVLLRIVWALQYVTRLR